MRRVATISMFLLLLSCDEEPDSDPTPTEEEAPISGTSETQASSAAIDDAERERRRAQVLDQLNDLRQSVINNPFGLVVIDEPVPANVPGLDGHQWTTEDTEQFGHYSWSPAGGRAGTTYGQFQVLSDVEPNGFIVVAIMDIDGDGNTSRATANRSTEAQVVDSTIW